MNRSGPCSVIAIYDWMPQLNMRSWFEFAVKWMAQVGATIERVTIDGNGYQKKPHSVDGARVAFDRHGLDAIGSITVSQMAADYKQAAFGWLTTASVTISRSPIMLFCTAGNRNEQRAIAMLSELSRLCRPVYGIGYERDFSKGPDMFAYGMIAGVATMERKESDQIGAWVRELMGKKRHRNGMLRDVFPLNLIGRAHLNHIAKTKSLEAWIKGANWGALLEVGSDTFAWTVPDRQIAQIREVLNAEGFLIAG